jgi:hypothetical protein
MKVPFYESTPGILNSILLAPASPTYRTISRYTIYSIALVGGFGLAYTDCQQDITVPGIGTWSSNTVRVNDPQTGSSASESGLYHAKVGLDVDTWQFSLYPRLTDDLTGAAFPDKIGSLPWLSAAAGGFLDGATVFVDRAYLDPNVPIIPGKAITPAACIRLFVGKIAEVDVGRTFASITVNSLLDLLNTQIPVNLFQAQCRHQLFDAGCQLSAASFATNITLNGFNRNAIQFPHIAVPGSGTLALGRVVFTSGVNNGFSRGIRAYAANVIAGSDQAALVSPLVFLPSAGDTATVYPGCDKSTTACNAFGNILNFGGEPFIPSPETAL